MAIPDQTEQTLPPAAASTRLIECCRRLAPDLESRATDAEDLRRLPDATMADLREIEFFSMLSPTSLGGAGLGLDTVAQSTRELARGCPSTAWSASFLALHAWLAAHFPAEAHQEMFDASGTVLAPAALAPNGQLEAVDGGYRLSGRWSWATGVMESDWVIVTGLGDDDGRLDIRFCALPVTDVAVDDVWHMAGMQATGSNDVVIDAAFVPEHRTLPVDAMMPGGPRTAADDYPEPFMRLPLMAVLVLTAAAPAVGAAERAVELFEERLETRVLMYTPGEKQADQPSGQIRLGTATAEARSARSTWEAAIDQVVETGATMSVEDRASIRLGAAQTVLLSRRAINTVCEASGASAYADTSPLQRIQRDVETLKGHVVFDWDRTAELFGRVRLGMKLRPGDLL